MTKWEIPISLDERPHALIVSAHSAAAALAQLERHRAAGSHNQSLQFNYATPDGARMSIRWGRAVNVTVGDATAVVSAPDSLTGAF
jgi:hypothetical protein